MPIFPSAAKKRKRSASSASAVKSRKYFNHELKSVLELIGNRIGLAIENAMLQEQYIKSEKKYRTLFNSDPHPIFILDSQTFEIRDMNQRAQDSYGYTREELLGLQFLEIGVENDKDLAQALKNLTEDQSLLFTKKAALPQRPQAVLRQYQLKLCKIRRRQCHHGLHHRYH